MVAPWTWNSSIWKAVRTGEQSTPVYLIFSVSLGFAFIATC